MFDFALFSGIITVLFLGSVAAKYGLLSEAGVLAAILVGGTIYVFGGWNWFILLMLFFALVSVFEKYKESEKKEVAREFEKGGTRDFYQVGANGALAALIAAAYSFYPFNSLYFAFLGTMAAVTADTLATELGVLSKKPRLITNFKLVPRGTSGAISLLGLLASAGAALAIGCAAVIVNNYIPNIGNYEIQATTIIGIVVAAGLAGSLFDSLLGATVQSMYYCNKCKKETERELHKCGEKTRYKRGWKLMNNDTVNLISSMVGAIAAFGLYNWLK